MIKRILAATLLTALPMTAHAGFGVTAALGSIENSIDDTYYSGQHLYPTFDYKSGPYLFQVGLLDIINSALDETDENNALVGVNFFYQYAKAPVAPNVTGVRQIGVTFDYDQAGEDINFTTIQAAGRFGAQASKKMGIGLYVVPELGVNIASEDAREDSMKLAVGGQVQLSVWQAGK